MAGNKRVYTFIREYRVLIRVLKTSLTSGAKQSKSKKADSTLKTGTYVGTNGTYVYDGTVLIEDEKVRQRDGYPEPIPKKNSDGVLLFSDAKEFRPNMTPKEVLQAGSFGGTYFRPIKSSVTGLKYNKMWTELPQNWLEGNLLGYVFAFKAHYLFSTYLI